MNYCPNGLHFVDYFDECCKFLFRTLFSIIEKWVSNNYVFFHHINLSYFDIETMMVLILILFLFWNYYSTSRNLFTKIIWLKNYDNWAFNQFYRIKIWFLRQSLEKCFVSIFPSFICRFIQIYIYWFLTSIYKNLANFYWLPLFKN